VVLRRARRDAVPAGADSLRRRGRRIIIPGMAKWRVHPEEELPRQTAALVEQVERDGGAVLAVYREPVGDHWHVFCLLPMEMVEPTPYQRDLSPTHVKRLQEVVKKIDRFVDPVVMMSPGPGRYWTPNGNHRRAVLAKLKTRVIPAILVPEPEVAYQILALNTEKAHNLKEKSLEVIRMYRGLAEEQPESGEEDYAFQFESAHFITLGLLYEQNKRFAGGAFAPILRRVDKFLKGRFPKTLAEREERAALVRAADEALGAVVAKIKKRGINHPYVKNYVLARTTPLTRQRKTLPGFEQTFKKLVDNIEAFDVSKVRYEDVQRSAVMAAPAAG
jgi:ParB family transcriptional regulator, chromosome partitioning protein